MRKLNDTGAEGTPSFLLASLTYFLFPHDREERGQLEGHGLDWRNVLDGDEET